MATDTQSPCDIGQVVVSINEAKPSSTPTALVLEKARDADLKAVLVLGYDADGREYIDVNIDDGGDAIWLLQRAIHKLMNFDGPK